jgi:hypothetical protein
MSSKTLSQKLSLRKETLTSLTEEDSSQAVGGGKVYTNYTCGEVVSCYDTLMHPCL